MTVYMHYHRIRLGCSARLYSSMDHPSELSCGTIAIQAKALVIVFVSLND